MLIAGPLVLPLVALYASKERSGIDARWVLTSTDVHPLFIPLLPSRLTPHASLLARSTHRFSQQRVERQFARAVRQLVALSEEGTAEVIEEVAAGMKAVEAAKESTDASSKASLEATSVGIDLDVRGSRSMVTG